MNSSSVNQTASHHNYGGLLDLPCVHPTAFDIIYTAAVVVDVMLSLPSNSWVIWLLISGKGGSLSSDIFIFNLAVTELATRPVVVGSLLSNYSVGTPSVMIVFIFLYGIIIVGRPLFQCCICVERYVAVVHPIIFIKYKALKYKLPFLAAVWLVATGLIVFQFHTQSYYTVTAIFLPMLAIDTFCSFSILRVLRQPRPGDGEREEMNLMKRRAFNTILLIQVMMVFNYMPIIIAAPLGPLYSVIESYCFMFPIAFSFSVYGSFVHSTLYLSRAGKLSCLTQMLSRLKNC